MWLWLVRFFCHAFMSIANQLLICLVSRRELESKKGKGEQANWLESCRHTGGLNVCAMYSCSASRRRNCVGWAWLQLAGTNTKGKGQTWNGWPQFTRRIRRAFCLPTGARAAAGRWEGDSPSEGPKLMITFLVLTNSYKSWLDCRVVHGPQGPPCSSAPESESLSEIV